MIKIFTLSFEEFVQLYYFERTTSISHQSSTQFWKVHAKANMRVKTPYLTFLFIGLNLLSNMVYLCTGLG